MAWHGNAQIDKDLIAGTTNARAEDPFDIFHLFDDRNDFLRQAVRRGIEQGIDGATTEFPTDVDDDERHNQCGKCIGAHQKRFLSDGFAEPHQRQTNDDDRRRPNIGTEMQCVGFQCLTVVLFRRAIQHPGARIIDDDGNTHRQKCPDAGINLDVLKKKPVDRFVDDPAARNKEQDRFRQRAEIFDFAVTVEMRVIRRAITHPHGKKSDQRRAEIERGMGGFGKNTQTAGHHADD